MIETFLKVNYIPDNFKNVIKLFFPGSIDFKITIYDNDVQSEILALINHCRYIQFIRNIQNQRISQIHFTKCFKIGLHSFRDHSI